MAQSYDEIQSDRRRSQHSLRNARSNPRKVLPSRKAKFAARKQIRAFEAIQIETSDSELGNTDENFSSNTSEDSSSDFDSQDEPKTPQRKSIRTNSKPNLDPFHPGRGKAAEDLFKDFDSKITNGELARRTGGVKITWNNRLYRNAGRTICSIKTKVHNGKVLINYRIVIELSISLVNNETRLLDVLGHEYCHIENMVMRGGCRKGFRHHGKEFMNCKAKVEKIFGAEISITHNYEINYRFAWTCTECGIDYRRRTKSVDVERDRCGECKGKLIQTRPIGGMGLEGVVSLRGSVEGAVRHEHLQSLTEAMGDIVLESRAS